jgi:hypothetical protein
MDILKKSLYESKSSNNRGFLAALLVEEKLWLPVIGNRRLFSIGTGKET